MDNYRKLLLILMISFFISCNKNEEKQTIPVSIHYFPIVKSIMQAKCNSCHLSSGTWAGQPVSFDTDSSISASSLIIKNAVVGPFSQFNKKMPQDDSLSTNEIQAIDSWQSKGGNITD